MTLNEITVAMQTYAAQRNQAGVQMLKNWYSQGNQFCYTRDDNNTPIPPATIAYVHVYPGVISNQLVFFVISGNKDVSTNQNIAADVQVCQPSMIDPLVLGTGGGGLPKNIAVARMQAWYNGYKPWISSHNGIIFQGFAVPQMDTVYGDEHNGYLALITDTSPASSAASDIVVEDIKSGTIKYFDTSLPVPPFTAATPEASFYLLSLV